MMFKNHWKLKAVVVLAAMLVAANARAQEAQFDRLQRQLDALEKQVQSLQKQAAESKKRGPHRVRRWLASRGHLPGETRAYVQAVTGHSVEDWAASRASGHAVPRHVMFLTAPPQRAQPDALDVAPECVSAGSKPCSEIAGLISAEQAHVAAHLPASLSSAPVLEQTVAAPEQTVAAPWGLQLIGDSSEVRALSAYRALQQRVPTILGDRNPLVLRTPANGPASWYRVRVAETNLQRANELCARLQGAGVRCLVQRNQ